MNRLVFDTETTGLPAQDCTDWDTARLVQLSWIVIDSQDDIVAEHSYLINDTSYQSTPEALSIHHISEELRASTGFNPHLVLTDFITACSHVDVIIFHSGLFDLGVIKNECRIHHIDTSPIHTKLTINTKKSALYRSLSPITLSECISQLDPSYSPPSNLAPHDALYDTYLCKHLCELSHMQPSTFRVGNTFKYIDSVIRGERQVRLC